jgi:hypothetical protein
MADGAIEVAIAPDRRYAFVSLEDANQIAVFNLARAIAHGFSAAGVYVGSIRCRLPRSAWLCRRTATGCTPPVNRGTPAARSARFR